jgi:hypothetical protein
VNVFKVTSIALCLWGIFKSGSFAIADKDGPKTGDFPSPLTLTKTIQGPLAAELS